MPLDFFNYLAKESVTYYPGGVTADAIDCDGVVIRMPSKVHLDSLVNMVEVWIPRGTLAGKVNAIDVGVDEILVKVAPYTSPVRCKVVRLLTSDAYTWKVMAAQ